MQNVLFHRIFMQFPSHTYSAVTVRLSAAHHRLHNNAMHTAAQMPIICGRALIIFISLFLAFGALAVLANEYLNRILFHLSDPGRKQNPVEFVVAFYRNRHKSQPMSVADNGKFRNHTTQSSSLNQFILFCICACGT
jgi:hypothetical protein